MRELALETVVELVGLALEIVAMIALSVIGLGAERAGLAYVASGGDPIAVWFIVVGSVALYAGVYMIGYRRLLPRITGRTERTGN